jgi:asparagine synthase (glutamine-hydrolysing)
MSAPFVLRRFTEGAGSPAAVAHASWRRIFSDQERDELLTPDFRASVRGRDSTAAFVEAFERAPAASDLDRLFYVDVKTFLPDSILPKVDTMTLAHGLEAREPLLDHRLVELGARLPWRFKLRGRDTKWIFKRAMASRVPGAIVRRAKAGFQPPFSAWFRGPLAGFVRDSLDVAVVRETGIIQPDVVARYVDEHLAARADHGLKLWSLLFFVAWVRHDFARRRNGAVLAHA